MKHKASVGQNGAREKLRVLSLKAAGAGKFAEACVAYALVAESLAADGAGIVLAAADAVLSVLGKAVINDPVFAQARDARGHGAVGIYGGNRLGRCAQPLGDAVARSRYRAVAVELIAKKVRHEQHARLHFAENEPARGFVALDNGAFAFNAAEKPEVQNKRCRDAGHEVCTRAVGAHAPAFILQCPLNYARGCSFAVCSGNGDYIDIFCGIPEHLGAYLQCQRSGERGRTVIKQAQ